MVDLDELSKKIDLVISDVTEIKTVLKGYNGKRGLCESHDFLARDYFSFKSKAVAIFLFLLGSGALGGTAWGILEFIKR